MKRLGFWFLALVLLGSFLGLFATGAGSQSTGAPTVNAYTTTFACGTFKEPAKAEGPVAAGEYRTGITVKNPSPDPVTITERAVILFRGTKETSRVRAAGAAISVQLPARAGTQIDCKDIRQGLLSGPDAPTFAEGLVTVEVPTPAVLSVVGLTTVVRDGEVNTVAVDRPAGEEVRASGTPSSPGASPTSSPRPTAGPTAGPSATPKPSASPSGGLIPGL
jgi:hypothetical protein